MPSMAAASVLLPRALSRAHTVSRCSLLLRERSSSGSLLLGGGQRPPISWGRLAREISGPSSITMARSRALRNWRTLPGQEQRSRAAAASLETPWISVSYTHLRAHETRHDLVCRLL